MLICECREYANSTMEEAFAQVISSCSNLCIRGIRMIYNSHNYMDEDKIIHKQLSYDINGLLFRVHNELGKYCNEKQVGDLLEQFLKEEGYNYEREKNCSAVI